MPARRPVGLSLMTLFVAFAFTGCGGVAARIDLVPGAAEVRTAKSDPPPAFVEIGPIEAVHGSGCGGFGKLGTYEGAYNTLRNKAVEMDFARLPRYGATRSSTPAGAKSLKFAAMMSSTTAAAASAV